MAVHVTAHYGILIRKTALARIGIDRARLLSILEATDALDEDDVLVSFGPHFGGEAADEFVRRLKTEGLEYADDFFVFPTEIPEWCGVSCYVSPDHAGARPTSR
jgi:hypothetical protein